MSSIEGFGDERHLPIVADPKNAAVYGEAAKKLGQGVIIQGAMVPAKDLKAAVPLQVSQVR